MNIEKWLEKNAKSLVGKRIAVTGSTGGIGRPLCEYIASLGASLVLLDRNPARSEAHAKSLREKFGSEVECIGLDMESLFSAQEAVERLISLGADVFIHNAGAYSIPRHETDGGYDNVYRINFATPYYMIRKLLPHLRERGGRVIAVGSIAHNYSKADPEDIDFSTRKASSKVYGNAKRYLMFSLFELFRNEDAVSLAVTHPGITFTNITAHYPKLVFAIIKHPMKVIFMRPRKAALSILAGLFVDCGYCEWIGPTAFGVWGYPKKKKLSTADAEERKMIGETAELVYEKQRRIIEDNGGEGRDVGLG